MKKKIGLLITAVLALALCLSFAACGLFPDNNAGTVKTSAYVALDINPSVELVVENGVVVSVKGLNYDARVMLYNSEGIVGATPAAASKAIAELAVKYGYVSEKNSEIGLTVSGADEESEKAIFAEVSASVTATALAGGVSVTVSEAAGVMIERELEELKAAYPDNDDIQSLTLKRFRVVKAAMNADKTLTAEAAAALDFDDLKDIIEDAYEEKAEYLDDAFELTVKRAEQAFKEATEPLLDAAYLTVDPERGAKYLALRSAYRTLEGIEEIDGELAEMAAITQEHLTHIADKLGLDSEQTKEFAEAVTDVNGYIDEDSVEYYLDKLERNHNGDSDDESEEFEELLDDIEDYLDDIEDGAESLTAELKAKAEAAIASVTEYLKNIETKLDSFDDIEDAADEIEDEIERLEEYFDENLTDEQKATVKEAQAAVSEQIEAAKAVFDKAVEEAKQAIGEALAQAQAHRLEIKVKA